MKRRINPLYAMSVVLLCVLCAGRAWATPREVTLFPASAQVVETTVLKAVPDGNLKKAVFTLPSQADPESLTAAVLPDSQLRIIDQTWRQIQRPDDDKKIRDLRKKLEALKGDRIALQATIRSLETQIQFWQMQTKTKVKTPMDAGNFAAAIGRNINKSFKDKLIREQEAAKLDDRIKDIEEDLNRAAGRKERLWEVTLLLAGAPAAREVSLRYAYRLSECGWSPLYRIEAKPGEGRILFSWEAEIWQSSGQDWTGVAMNLATLQPSAALSPQELPPWVIRPRPAPIAKKASRKKVKPEALAADIAEAPADASASTPSELHMNSYSLWELGRISLAAGVRQRIKVRDEAWTADFTHLLRPERSGKAFVQGALHFPEARDIPSGQAVFLVDGAILGKRVFAFSGKEGNLFFGEDPFVTAKIELLTQQSGERRFLADKQTYQWEWRTEIENRRNSPVRMRIEESLPLIRDERIKLTIRNQPEASEQSAAAWIWNLDAPPGLKQSILTAVNLEAPREINLDLGWRK